MNDKFETFVESEGEGYDAATWKTTALNEINQIQNPKTLTKLNRRGSQIL